MRNRLAAGAGRFSSAVLPLRGRAMGLRNVVCAACGVLAVGWGAMAQETVKLEYKLQPGTELIYKSSGTIKESVPPATLEGTISGRPRFVIADVDAATGVMLVGQMPEMKFAATIKGQGADQTQEQTFNDVSACRIDRAGNPVVRKMKDIEKLHLALRMMFGMLRQRQLDVVTLPAGPVAVGATWESTTDSALAGLPLPVACNVSSTLAEVKTVDGHRCALIRSKLTPGDKKAGGGLPEFIPNGEVETLFDVDGGFSRSVKSKLDIKAPQGSQEIAISLEQTSVLDSMKTLPPEQFAAESKVIRTLDGAIAAVYDGEYNKATNALENLKPADMPEAWKAGINKAIGTVKQIAQMAKGGGPMATEAAPADPAQKLFAEAGKAVQDQKWADAAAKFKEIADKYPDNALAPSALIEAARITETNLSDKKSADELRQRAVAMQEKLAAAGNPIELFKLASFCASSGDLEKAVATYRKFLAADDPKIPANTRLLAQYRIGGLLEKQGKTAEAAEAYKAMAAMSANDDYSTKLKEQAKKKAEALAAPTTK
jgi:TolA-binding protein